MIQPNIRDRRRTMSESFFSKAPSIGRGLLKLFLLIVPLLLLIDWSSGQATKACEGKLPPQASQLTKEFYLKQYETAAQEIRLRLDNEDSLFVLKFTALGAVLAMIFQTLSYRTPANFEGEHEYREERLLGSPRAAIVCWVAIAVAAVIDIRTFYNTNVIRELGQWICNLEMVFTYKSLLGWQSYLKLKSEMFSKPLTPLLLVDRQLLTWLMYIATVVIYIPVNAKDLREDPREDQRKESLLNIAIYFLPLTLILFGVAGSQYYYKNQLCLAIYWLVVAVLIISFIIILQKLKIKKV